MSILSLGSSTACMSPYIHLSTSLLQNNMSQEIGQLLSQLVKTAPPGELEEVHNDLVSIVPSQLSVVSKTVTRLAENQGMLLSGKGIAHQENKDSASGKFWDFKEKKKYNTSFKGGKVYDVEAATPTAEYPVFYDDLSKKLEQYGDKHFPSEFAFEIVPVSSTKVSVTLIGQKLNKSNFYTGRWHSRYVFQKSQTTHGEIALDIHYYEEGNVRLDFKETVDEPCEFSADAIVEFIRSTENAVSIKAINQFNLLNQKYFKNLRRLLPVTKSKINWGNAIGNYKLGTDVVNER